VTCSYQIQTKLDCGDIGMVDVTVDGFVTRWGLFGHTAGKVEKVRAHFPTIQTPIEVTSLLSRGARVDLEEKLERAFERDRNDPRGGDDDFREGA
jgi:hypothetical protein